LRAHGFATIKCNGIMHVKPFTDIRAPRAELLLSSDADLSAPTTMSPPAPPSLSLGSWRLLPSDGIETTVVSGRCSRPTVKLSAPAFDGEFKDTLYAAVNDLVRPRFFFHAHQFESLDRQLLHLVDRSTAVFFVILKRPTSNVAVDNTRVQLKRVLASCSCLPTSNNVHESALVAYEISVAQPATPATPVSSAVSTATAMSRSKRKRLQDDNDDDDNDDDDDGNDDDEDINNNNNNNNNRNKNNNNQTAIVDDNKSFDGRTKTTPGKRLLGDNAEVDVGDELSWKRNRMMSGDGEALTLASSSVPSTFQSSICNR
jgi:hypothetical protein